MATWKELGFKPNYEYKWNDFTPEQRKAIKEQKWASFCESDSIIFHETEEDVKAWLLKSNDQHEYWLKNHTVCNPTFNCPLGHNK